MSSFTFSSTANAFALRGAQVVTEWNGETSATHAWIVLDLTAQTFSTQSVPLSDLSARLTYQGKYAYDASAEFDADQLEPLVVLPGRFVFRVPLLVAQQDPSALSCELTDAGQSVPVALSYAPAAGLSEAVFFDAPEDAVVHFSDCLRRGDFAGALDVTAAGAMAEGYKLSDMLVRLGVLTPSLPMLLPSEYPGYIALTRIGQLNQLRSQLVWLVESLLIDPKITDMNMRPIRDGVLEIADGQTITVDEYLTRLDPARLEGLKLLAVYCLNNGPYRSEMNQKNIKRRGVSFGYTDEKEFLSVYMLDGRLYSHACTAVRFEKGWQIMYLYGPIQGTNSLGGASSVSVEEASALMASGDYLMVYPKA